MKHIFLMIILSVFLLTINANAFDYQIAEYSPDPNPPQLIVPDRLYNDVATLGYGPIIRVHSHNSSGQFVGIVDDGFNYAFIWDATNGAALIPDMSDARDINESGQVAGYNAWPPYISALIWDSAGGTLDIGSLGYKFNYALGINDFGTVVGSSAPITDSGTPQHAFIWNSQEGMNDLNNYLPESSGWILSEAWDIDSKGEIIGTGTLNGETRSFVITPTVVPEPVSSILFLTGGAALVGRRYFSRIVKQL